MKKKNFLIRSGVTFIAAFCFCNLAFSQIHITNRAGLADINANLTESYVLDNDIDLSGTNWTPLGNFKGTLNGNGHVIHNLRIDNLDAAAFFNTISGNAVIKNLGFENALVTDATHARTAVLAAFMEGDAIIENCYIANSTIMGRWCVGSFVGRARNLTVGGTAAIRNCYSSAYLYCPDYNGTAAHVGGIIGNIFAGNKITIENCYFSGIIQKILGNNTEGQVAGIIGWLGTDGTQTLSGYVIRNNVNLAPYLLSNYGKRRISSTRNGEDVNNPTPGPNYSLSTTVVSAYNDWGNSSAIISTGTTTNKDGANFPNGDSDAKSQVFYQTTLGWNFTASGAPDTNPYWTISEGSSYPVLSFAKDTTNFVVVPVTSISLASGDLVDLSKYIFSGRGRALTFTTTSNKINISGSMISAASSIIAAETVTVSVQEGSLTPLHTLNITLVPDITISTPEDLEQIRTSPAGKYVLTADLDLSGIANFTPIPNFSGVLDGNNHVISGLSVDVGSNVNSDETAFIKRTSAGAVIRNLGFENADIVSAGGRVAVLVGLVNGSTTIENCYVANSTVRGRWCVGSFVGRATGALTIRNCYSSAYLFNPEINDNQGHTGGIIGHLNNNSSTVENCYFSGVIQMFPYTFTNMNEGQVAGIVAWNGSTANVIRNNVNLAPYLLSVNATGRYRISSNNLGQSGNDPTGPNYSLSTTVVSDMGNLGTTSDIIADDNIHYALEKKHGANIPGGDANAKAADFYATTLGWNFSEVGVWAINEGNGYPHFKWADQTRSHFVVPQKVIDLTNNAPVDLSKYIFSGRGLGMTFSTTSNAIAVNDGVVNQIAAGETAVVLVQEGSLTPAYSLNVALAPDFTTGIRPINSPVVSLTSKDGEIQATFEGIASVKLYSVTGLLLDKVTASDVYTYNVKQGVYILSVDGKSYKAIVK